MRLLLFLFLAACLASGGYAKSYKICVPDIYLGACREMVKVETKSKATVDCVAARDRVECLYFVQQRLADFVPVDPEDMYIAEKIPNQDFVLFQEYRTNEEPDAEFRYEAVMVVHKDLEVNNLDGLRNLKSCHTGVNRNVGYKIPLTMLRRLTTNFPPMNDHNISPKENELKALSTYFNRSCIVGQWSPDNKTTTILKNRYRNLCSLCEDPLKCDYPDNYSGYEGALRCLVHNGGQVAFTKVIYVRKFFGLAVGTTPAGQASANPDDYVYLCADGSKVSVRHEACSWAARPWQGLLGHHDILAKLSDVRQKVKQLAEIGNLTKPDWFTKVLGLSEKINHVAQNIPITPADYLNKSNYTAVIERGHGAPEPVVRLCVTRDVELTKCRMMGTFAFSRDIRPRLDCVKASSETECLVKVRDNGAEFTSVYGTDVARASKQYGLHPVFHEVYGTQKTPPYVVAVVKKGSMIDNVNDLRGKRSCHGQFGKLEGVDAAVYVLVLNKITQPPQCPRLSYLAKFFSGGSCLPGVEIPLNNPTGESVSSLIKQCDDNPALNSPEDCLKNGRGDVAFMSSTKLELLDDQQYELLCLNKQNGGVDHLSNYTSCHIALAPFKAWLTAKDFISDESVAHTPLSLAQLAEDRPDLFRLYGQFLKNDDIIFSNHATGLATTDTFDYMKLKSIHDSNNFC